MKPSSRTREEPGEQGRTVANRDWAGVPNRKTLVMACIRINGPTNSNYDFWLYNPALVLSNRKVRKSLCHTRQRKGFFSSGMRRWYQLAADNNKTHFTPHDDQLPNWWSNFFFSSKKDSKSLYCDKYVSYSKWELRAIIRTLINISNRSLRNEKGILFFGSEKGVCLFDIICHLRFEAQRKLMTFRSHSINHPAFQFMN